MRRLRPLLPLAIPLVAIVVLVAGGALAAIETDTVGSFGEGVWWAVSLMSTVGFAGDTPATTGGRVISGLLMLFGFALLTMVTAGLASLVIREQREEVRERSVERELLAELRAVRERLERLEGRSPPGP